MHASWLFCMQKAGECISYNHSVMFFIKEQNGDQETVDLCPVTTAAFDVMTIINLCIISFSSNNRTQPHKDMRSK